MPCVLTELPVSNLFNKLLALLYVKKLFVSSLPFLSVFMFSVWIFLFCNDHQIIGVSRHGDSWGSFRWWWCCCLVLSVVANPLLSTFCRIVLFLQLLAHMSTLKLNYLMFKLCLMALCCAFGFPFSIWIIVTGYFPCTLCYGSILYYKHVTFYLLELFY